MFVFHIALQGCLRASNVAYGVTPDTGGHIRYLLELVEAADGCDAVDRQIVVTRRFADARLGEDYDNAGERISRKSEIVRLAGATQRYLAKEELHTDLPALADNLERYLAGLERLPDVIHAHYADAGWLAAEMKTRLGIPYLFTAHSLGRVKRAASGDGGDHAILDRRIAIEERAIADADRIIASSLDEAELQYPLYDAYRPEAIRLNPPGCNLDTFRNPLEDDGEIAAGIERFLDDSSKPCILALARPVRKKNLAGLVHAYGKSPALQAQANLVIFAGTRERIADEDEEPREVLGELLHLIDQYDLYGRVAMPKSHRPEHVASIYDYAVRRRGVFANVALNEPFGLTFLEAAAAGLPVVATDSGGPNDILAHCKNGLLVDPNDHDAIADALQSLVTDESRWEEASHNGRERCSHYSWERHAADYVAEMRSLILRPRPEKPRRAGSTQMLVCDIDGTLTGDARALADLSQWVGGNAKVTFGIATGRSLHSAVDVIRQWNIPTPEFLITSVGSELYWTQGGDLRRLRADAEWPGLIARSWNIDAMGAALSELDFLVPQAEREKRRYKLSYFLDRPECVGEVERLLRRRGFAVELIFSHGRYLDILPQGVSKGHAIHHVARILGVPIDSVLAAGDSGNDLHMLSMVGRPIVVANHTNELAPLRSDRRVYFSKHTFAGGVLDGVRFHKPGDLHDEG